MKPLDSKQALAPRVSIGLPVFNGEKTLKAAIDAILSQTLGDYILIISDNGSTDATEIICRDYVSRDGRIHYYRQTTKICAEENFHFVLDKAKSEYFMWASADDVRSPDFIEINADFLERNPDYVCSTCPTRFEDDSFDAVRMGDAPLDDKDPKARFMRFFSTWHSNGRYYGLYRRDALRDCYQIERPFLGCDWTVVLRACLVGKTNRTDRGWIVLGSKGLSNRDIFSAYRRHWYEWLAPLSKLYSDVRKISDHFSPSAKVRLFLIFVFLNAQGVRVQILRSLVWPMLNHVLRRHPATNSGKGGVTSP
jgi:glycosyltransferase involved in cell wall biosynthesis